MRPIAWAAKTGAGMALHAVSSGAAHVIQCTRALEEPPPYRVSGPLVSVIIPALQEEDWVGPLLASIQNQTYEPIEAIIVDSSPPESKEATRQVASAYGARVVDCGLGIALARNVGARAAKGDILLFCDADGFMAHDFVERLIVLLDNGAALGHGNDILYDSMLRNALHSLWLPVKPRMATTGRGVAIRTEDFWAVGGYDEACEPMEGCREDTALGRAVEEFFGPGAVQIDRHAFCATSARRPLSNWPWPHRGYRGEGGVIDRRRYARSY